MQDLMERAEGELRHEPVERRVRATLGSETAVDSTRPILIWEPRRVVPSYAVPVEDIRAELSPAAAQADDVAGLLHPGIPFAVHTPSGDPISVGDRVAAGFRLADDDLADYLELDFDAFDDWYEEDERIAGHPRSPFHSIHVHRSSRPVRIELDGVLVAETTRARLLSETSLPLRCYLPLEDVRAELHPSSRRTYCPHKGEASYWSLDASGRRRGDLGWTYEQPLPEAVAITGSWPSGTSSLRCTWTASAASGRPAPSPTRCGTGLGSRSPRLLPPRPVRGRDRDLKQVHVVRIRLVVRRCPRVTQEDGVPRHAGPRTPPRSDSAARPLRRSHATCRAGSTG